MSTTEVGVAYVRLVPSMDGFKADVVRELGDSLTKPARQAGEDAGKALAKGLEDGVNGADLDSVTSGIGDKLKLGMAAVGVAGGALLVEGLTSAMDLEATTDKLAAQLGGGEFAQQAGEAAAHLYTSGFGESVGEAADLVRRLFANGIIDEGATQEEIDKVAGQFGTFTDVLEQDMDMTTQAVKSMITSGIADSSEQALDVLTAGMTGGADKAGDLLETFQEYSTMFRDVGLSGEQAMGLISQSLGAGARDADTAADAIKEFAIRAQDGSDTSRKAFEALGIDAETAMLSVASGGDSARLALQYTLEALNNMEDPVARNAAAVGLFGTKAEDLGDALFAMDLETATDRFGDISNATEDLGSAYDNASSKIESFKRGALMELTEFVGGAVIPGLESLWDLFGPDVTSVLSTVGDTLSTVKDKVGEFWSALTTGMTEDEGTPIERIALAIRDAWQQLADTYNTQLKPALDELVAKGKELVEGIDWTTVWEELQPILAAAGGAFMSFATMVITAVGQAIEGITRFITKVQELWREHETFRATVTAVWDLVSTKIITAINIISGVMQLATALMRGDWSAAWDAIKQIASNAWESIKADFRAAIAPLTSTVSNGLNSIVGFFRSLPGQISSAISTVAGAITNPFRSAFNSIRDLWNRTIGGFSFKVPDWIPSVGGKGFSIPKMHGGGIFDAPGGEGLALLKSGEGVFTPDQMAAIGSGAVSAPAGRLSVMIEADDRRFKEWLRYTVRTEAGGSAEQWFGSN